MNPYEATADVLVQRIVELIPKHPEILKMTSPWDLFSVQGFVCSDLNPTMHQAAWALEKAKTISKRLS